MISASLACGVLAGCLSITAEQPGPRIQSSRAPTFETANVTGLISTTLVPSGVAVGSTSAMLTPVYGSPLNAWAVAATGITVSFSATDSYEAQEFLRRVLEDSGTVKKISAASPVELRGVFLGMEKTTGAWNVWNYASQIIPIALLGTPLVGSREATVEIRVYRDGEFAGSVIGKGRCSGHATIYGAQEGIVKLEGCAQGNAIANAVYQLQNEFRLEPL
jgi:hypothetical protein